MATASIDTDAFGAASLRNMAAHLTAPLATGAVESPIPIAAGGGAAVGFPAREPLLLVAPRTDLGPRGLLLAADTPEGTATVEFAPYTEHAAALPLYRPPTPATGFAEPFELTITSLEEVLPDGTKHALAPAEIATRVELELVEGVLGRLLYAIGAEKQRLRRAGRELSAMRRLGTARDDALDRVGAELAIPRFADDLRFEAGDVVTAARREPDEEYCRRLAIYRPWLLRTHRGLLELLNGPGGPSEANAGPIGQMGLHDRFNLVERDNPFALAVHVVGAEDATARDNFFEFVRQVHLIWPAAGADPVHAARFVPEARRQQIEALRADLREGFGFATPGPSAALAPMLASALARVWRCRKHLRATTRWPVTRAQEGAGGSRYELGLGADLKLLPANELDRLGEEHAAGRPTEDPEVGALMGAMTPRSAAEDPEGRWLLEPCGLRTVHRVDAAAEYVSHLPAFGLAITGPDQVEPTGWTAILRGYFALESRQTSLLFYERATGTGAFYVVDGSGGIFLMQEHAGWRTSWTHIVVGDFGGGVANDLLFYERSTGSAEIYATDGAGAIALLSQFSDWRRTWAQVVTGSFGGPGSSDLLLYDRAAGEIELLAIDAAAGAISLLGRQTGERRSWSLIAALPSGQGTGTELAFYDRAAGLLERRRPDGNGGLPVVGRHPNVGRGWTHAISGRFGGATGSDLLLYDRTSGRAVVYALADDGGIELVREESGWRRTWTQLVPGQFGGGGAATDVLFYDRATGTGAFYAGSPSGTFRPLRRHADWRRSSAQQFEARYHAAGDPGANVVLVNGIAAADAAWRGPPHNGSPWSSVTRAQAVAAWQAATARPDDDPALGVLRAAGLPAVAEPGPTVEQLERVPAELVETVRLAPAQAQAILAGHPAAAGGLRDLAGVLRAQRIASVLPLLGGAGDVLLVLGAIGLPGAGVNLQDRRSTGFRWYALPIQGSGAEVSATGSRALFTPADAGAYALVVVGYARTGDTDPYEFRVELPAGSLLDVRQYEFLMNLLDHAFPAGVEVNTYSIRGEHVDLDGDGSPEPLSPAILRTYRSYRRRRHRGEVAVTLPDARPGG